MRREEAEKLMARLPVYNSFEEWKKRPLVQKFNTWIILLIVTLTFTSLSAVEWKSDDETNAEFDNMKVTVVNFGEFRQLRKRRKNVKIVVVDEVFGNKYVKKKEDEKKVDLNDPNIEAGDDIAQGAQQYIPGAATAPLDLTPHIQPEYTPAARSAGVEGNLTLELIISEKGQVLRARVVGKKRLGYGLERAAVRAFQQKKFKPSINSDGKTIKIKIYQPVQFRLI